MLSAIKEIQDNVSPAGTLSIREEMEAQKIKLKSIELSLETIAKSLSLTAQEVSIPRKVEGLDGEVEHHQW